MTELSPDVRALLAQAGAKHDPSEQELERGLDVLHTSLAFSAPLVAASVASASAQATPSAFSSGALVSAKAVKLYLVAASVIGSVGTVAVWSGGTSEPKREASVVEAATPAPSNLGAELSLIEAAQRALQDAAPERALTQLAEHAQTFPRGMLASEREGLRAIALCDAGRTHEGQQARSSFLDRFGSTPIAARVRKACP